MHEIDAILYVRCKIAEVRITKEGTKYIVNPASSKGFSMDRMEVGSEDIVESSQFEMEGA